MHFEKVENIHRFGHPYTMSNQACPKKCEENVQFLDSVKYTWLRVQNDIDDNSNYTMWWLYAYNIGEVLFLAWGVRVCYVVRNAESFYNEAQSINFAIYNICIVNIIMMTIQ